MFAMLSFRPCNKHGVYIRGPRIFKAVSRSLYIYQPCFSYISLTHWDHESKSYMLLSHADIALSSSCLAANIKGSFQNMIKAWDFPHIWSFVCWIQWDRDPLSIMIRKLCKSRLFVNLRWHYFCKYIFNFHGILPYYVSTIDQIWTVAWSTHQWCNIMNCCDLKYFCVLKMGFL